MSTAELERTLRDLPRVGTLVKDRGYRQVWRFEHGGRGYFLKFYPREASRLKRLARGNSAMREFQRLQWLQKAGIPAPHAVAVLVGFVLNGAKGDAVLLDAIEPAVPLDAYLHQHELRAEPAPDRYELGRRVLELVHQLGQAKLGHGDLHLGNFLVGADGKVYLLDGHAVRKDGLRRRDVLQLGHSVARYATRGDLVRGWRLLGDGGPMPPRNPVSRGIWHRFLDRAGRANRYFGRLDGQGWSGVFFKQYKYPYRWSAASRLDVSTADWERAWPALLGQIESGGLECLKRSRSGDVLAGEVAVGGRQVPVVVKHPRRRYWYRYVNEIGRGARARRAWFKSWGMIVRSIPTAWPLLLMERRRLGYVVDQVIVLERVPGESLAGADLDAMDAGPRDLLFRRLGRTLRRIEQFGFSHFDAKSSNFMVMNDDLRGPVPVLIDIDGVRHRTWVALGVQRLLRSLREHPQYDVPDSLALCQGYAPAARLVQEEADQPEPDADPDATADEARNAEAEPESQASD